MRIALDTEAARRADDAHRQLAGASERQRIAADMARAIRTLDVDGYARALAARRRLDARQRAAARRREEAETLKWRRFLYDSLPELKKPRPLWLLEWKTRDVLENMPPAPALAAELERHRRHLEQLAKALRVTLRVASSYVNAYHLPRERAIEGPPVRSRWSVAAWLHELGHAANPCRGHRRAHAEDGRSVCCRCETAAWAWARANSFRGEWDHDMQACLRESLESYLRFATRHEAAEMRTLMNQKISRLARLELLQAKLDRAMRPTLPRLELLQARLDRAIAGAGLTLETNMRTDDMTNDNNAVDEYAVRPGTRPTAPRAALAKMKEIRTRHVTCSTCRRAPASRLHGGRPTCDRCADRGVGRASQPTPRLDALQRRLDGAMR